MFQQIIATKLYTPPRRETFVRRNRLMNRLADGIGRKLTLVSAPAGYGKTALLCDWVHEQQSPSKQAEIETTVASLQQPGSLSIRVMAMSIALWPISQQQSTVSAATVLVMSLSL